MSRRSKGDTLRRLAVLVCVAITASLGTGTLPAAQAESHTKVRTSLVEASNHRFPNGDPGGLGYEMAYEVTEPISPGEWLPTPRIDATEHPEAFDGHWADAGFQAAWMSPKGEYQFFPDPFTVESGYLDNYVQEDGVPLAPGDSFDMAVKQLPEDTPLTWDRERGEATGEPEWEIATKTHTVSGSYGGVEGDMEVVFVRADLVARGGDLDSRDASTQLPPLVVDLPRSYGATVQGSAATAQFAPYLHYITNLEGQVLPQTGKAVFTARTRGYLPEAREITMPGGAHIKEWHIPLNIVITLRESKNPLDGGLLTGMPGGGVVTNITSTGSERMKVPAGSTVAIGSDLGPRILPSGPRSAAGTTSDQPPAAEDAPGASSAGAGTLLDDIRATAPIDHTLAEPAHFRIAKRSYSLTVDPDLDGNGTLGLREYDHVRSGKRFFGTIAVPWVEVDGERIPLTSDRLTDLRVVPFVDYIRIGFTGRSDGNALDDMSTVRARHGRIQRSGVLMTGVYDLGEDRYAFTEAWSYLHAGNTSDAVATYVVVRSLSEEPVHVNSLSYAELAQPGPVTYGGETRTSEFSGPGGVIQTPDGRVGFGAPGGSRISVVRAGAPIDEMPQPDPSASIEGQPIAVYMTSADGANTSYYAAGISSTLDDVARRTKVAPAPVEAPCTDVPVTDASGDVSPHLDVEGAWFDFDGETLYSTIQVAELEEDVLATPVAFQSSWRFEHLGFGFRADRDVAGAWTYRLGNHPSSGSSLNPIRTAEGELTYGSPGYIRMSYPVNIELTGTGFLDGELLRDTGAVSYDTNAVTGGIADRAGGGAPEYAYGRGGDYKVEACPATLIDTVLELTVSGKGSKRLLEARLARADDPSIAIPGALITFFADGTEIGEALTDADGRASLVAPPRYRGGSHLFEAVFEGDELHRSSEAETSSP